MQYEILLPSTLGAVIGATVPFDYHCPYWKWLYVTAMYVKDFFFYLPFWENAQMWGGGDQD